MIVLGAPNLLKIFICINSATVLTSFMGQVIASNYLDTYSIARRMYRFANDDGKGPMKSVSHTYIIYTTRIPSRGISFLLLILPSL